MRLAQNSYKKLYRSLATNRYYKNTKKEIEKANGR